MNTACLVVGAGGHGRVVADALLAAGQTVAGFIDRDEALHGVLLLGLPVLGGDEVLEGESFADLALVNGIGGTDEGLRRKVQERMEAKGRRFRGVWHPASLVSPWAYCAEDAQLLAGSIVQPGAWIGPGCIINTRALVEHDCRLDAYVHCAPGSILCGDVVVGEGSHIGAGAVVRQGLNLGPGTLVGAGASVVANHAGGARLVGVPARPMVTGRGLG